MRVIKNISRMIYGFSLCLQKHRKHLGGPRGLREESRSHEVRPALLFQLGRTTSFQTVCPSGIYNFTHNLHLFPDPWSKMFPLLPHLMNHQVPPNLFSKSLHFPSCPLGCWLRLWSFVWITTVRPLLASLPPVLCFSNAVSTGNRILQPQSSWFPSFISYHSPASATATYP